MSSAVIAMPLSAYVDSLPQKEREELLIEYAVPPDRAPAEGRSLRIIAVDGKRIVVGAFRTEVKEEA